jgi:PAS domain S-box-containing protein
LHLAIILMSSAIPNRRVTTKDFRACTRAIGTLFYRLVFFVFSLIVQETEEVKKQSTEEAIECGRMLQFETGALSKEIVEAMLDSLPVDISFVDREDRVKYFNKAEGRIFVRTKAVIGRKVQLCHPQKSVHVVNKILEAFKTGRKDVAEFWIQMNNRLIHIRYFAVRDKNRKYLGTLEVTQDITDIKKIEGQRRLLDWKT